MQLYSVNQTPPGEIELINPPNYEGEYAISRQFSPRLFFEGNFMPKLEEINLEYNPKSTIGYNHSPFTIAFCYSRNQKPFVVKGGWVDVEEFLISKKEPLLVHITYWKMKAHRTVMSTYNLTQDIHFEEVGKRWRIFTFKDNVRKNLAIVRRIPRKWLKELNPYCPVKRGEHKRLFRLEVIDAKN